MIAPAAAREVHTKQLSHMHTHEYARRPDDLHVGLTPRTRARWSARGPDTSHAGPMVCMWAAPPTCMSSGLRAYQGVNAHIQRFACEQHATTDSKSAKVQTHSAKTGHFQRLSSNGSVLWRPHHLEARPRRRQSGGIAPCKGATRRRHAARGLRMAQNPHRPPVWRTPVARRTRPQCP